MPPSNIETSPIAYSQTLGEMLWFNHRLFLRAIAKYDGDWALKQSTGGCAHQAKKFIESICGGKPKGWLREMVTFAQNTWAE